MNASESSEGFFGLSIGRAGMTSHSHCAKDSALCDTEFFFANVGCWRIAVYVWLRRCGWRIAVYVWLENFLRVLGELRFSR